MLLLTAIQNVAVEDADGTVHIDRQAVRDELAKTSDFAGIIGTITCDDFGDCGSQRISVILHDGSDPADAINNVVFSATREELLPLIAG